MGPNNGGHLHILLCAIFLLTEKVLFLRIAAIPIGPKTLFEATSSCGKTGLGQKLPDPSGS